MIGGEVALRISPRFLAELAAPYSCVVVTGTNGKSTTTRMVRAALERGGPVASNTNGDNMTSGVITALTSVDGQASSVVGRQRRRGGVRAVIEGTIVPGR